MAAGIVFAGTILYGQSAPRRCQSIVASAQTAREAVRLKEALSFYRQALRCNPEWAEGWWDLGTIYYEQDSYANAVAAFEKLKALAPNRGDGLAMLGLSEAKLGRKRAALLHLRQARKLGLRDDPAFLRVVWFTEASLLLDAGSFGKAQEMFEALARGGAGALELAIPLGQAVLGVRPGSMATTGEAAAVVEKAGRAQWLAARSEAQSAREAWEALVKEQPAWPNLQFAYGRFLLSIYDDDGAVRAFQAEIAARPKHVLAHLGIAGAKAGADPELALPYARRAVELAPNLAESRYLKGMILLNLGKAAEALQELETARRLAPKEAKIYFQLARAYARTGRSSDAARMRERFLEYSGASGPAAEGHSAHGDARDNR